MRRQGAYARGAGGFSLARAPDSVTPAGRRAVDVGLPALWLDWTGCAALSGTLGKSTPLAFVPLGQFDLNALV